MEDKLVAHAQTQGAPRLPGEVAARRLCADAALLDAQLRGRAHDTREQSAPRGLRLDQAAAVWHALTSPRTLEVITGPAGTGKTRVLAAAAQAWGGPVFGTATSQNAANELRKAGVRVTANTTRLLASLDTIPPGALIVVDEGSMVSLAHLAALAEYAARNGCKLVLAGDQEQLAAVGGGGAMMLLADRLGYVQLAEPVRFTAAWERHASLRLREGDATALDEYDQHGRIRGAPPDLAAISWPTMCVAGDLNVVEPGHRPPLEGFEDHDYAFYARLTQSGLDDAYRYLNPDGTDHSWASDRFGGQRLDHALISPATGTIRECRYDHAPRTRRLTDHAALVITVGPDAGK